MIKERLGSDVDTVVYRLFPFVRSLRVHPDTLTLAGALVSFFAAWALAEEQRFGAGLLLMVAGFFDLVDGVVARQQGLSSSAGAGSWRTCAAAVSAPRSWASPGGNRPPVSPGYGG